MLLLNDVYLFLLKGESMEEKIFDSNIEILSNGLKLISVKKQTGMCSIHAGIKIGSLYENSKEKGICHFIEHMLFKGTYSRNNEELNNDLEQRGGEYNAYTNYDSTVYSITALCEEIEPSIELISDMLQNSNFPVEELEKERGVILSEIRTSKDDIEDYCFRRLHEIAFSKSPLRYDTLGDEKTVGGLTRTQLVNFYKAFYVPNNCIMTIVSPYDHEEIIKLINRYFKLWEEKSFERKKVVVEKNISCKEITYKKDIEQAAIAYAFSFHNLNKEEELALRILNHKFGESSNSMLFRELREERGLAYDIYSDLDLTSNVKVLYIYTSVGIEAVDEAMEAIKDCINEIKNEVVKFDESTTELMKKVLKTAVTVTLEDSTDLGNYILHQILEDISMYEFVEDMKNLEKIKAEHIYDVARKVFQSPSVHILLPEME
jgi:predicted Zn-dependent peptidase